MKPEGFGRVQRVLSITEWPLSFFFFLIGLTFAQVAEER